MFHLVLLILTRYHTFLGKPKYEIVRNGNETQLVSPEEVSAQVLTKLKVAAEKKWGKRSSMWYSRYRRISPIRNVSPLKMPPLFAGLNVVRIVNEPTAAAEAIALEAYALKVMVFMSYLQTSN